MPLKRDVVLFCLVVTFLVMGIVSTSAWQRWSAGERSLSSEIITTDSVERTAVMAEPVDEAALRAERLARLRAQLAAEEGSLIAAAPVVEMAEEEVEPSLEESRPASTGLSCAAPTRMTVSWDPRSLTVQESEGALLVYRSVSESMILGTSTQPVVGGRDVILQLPLRSFPISPLCIPTDVIGIALDGSLIRTSESALYGIFGADTQVGYTLDGFPLYGSAGSPAVDECGGAVVGGSYRFYVQPGPAVIGCFMAPPSSLY